TTMYQPIEGFGAALTDSSAYLMQDHLTTAQRTALVNDLFTQSEGRGGLGLSFVRKPMGASDYSLSEYTYDDNGCAPVYALSHFAVAAEPSYDVSALQQILRTDPNAKVLATPWSPPAWMKTPCGLEGGTIDGDAPTYAALANYFTDFVRAYGAETPPIPI